MNTTATGLSHAKIIFLGEHSAVYQKPAIVFPVPQIKAKAIISSDGHNQLNSKYYSGPISMLPSSMNGLQTLINQLNKLLNRNNDPIDIEIDSEIPLGRGMGSSAATASAVTRAFFNFFKQPISQKQLKSFTDVEEKITHGNPSGIDAKTVSSIKPILFEKGQFYDFPVSTRGQLIIADTGVSSNTSTAVAMVRDEMDRHFQSTSELIDDLGNLVESAKSSLQSNQLEQTGKLMNLAQDDLTKLGVSSVEINTLVNAANQAGALGAKLTGSGLGGCIIVLSASTTTTEQIKTALKQNGAHGVWIQSLNEMK
ncbi:mevalonate kinase [Fructilactobacillus fructivorans]|uniref:mevalonate kinase n=1 Tax=Fructilactobacillus fructivorans TaxID=1614 RepID=A0A0C1Q2Z5_9LACO|nr:mevalonate kinase [Fructilactobacillus fructivorans]KID42183.1 Mevalonate kinase [Fructilactobacillus fructivorans]MCT0152076.1 mevalonate kinase [Fructilactobacillus fructivorans]MCT2867968.1 mevalonate kinase [Fructilactobacillus fructivorans]MCT2868450.1 mevalonate kinase [Fructilactobacillus fructivorans]MCT2873450.1 mevalonate kinase [Fructilactobacillus fructivorans]